MAQVLIEPTILLQGGGHDLFKGGFHSAMIPPQI